MKQIAEQRDAEWQSNRGEAAEERERRSAAKSKKTAPAKTAAPRKKSAAKNHLGTGLEDLPAGKPRFISPMKPKLLEEAPTAGDWIYELKFDGFSRDRGRKTERR
jgi:bifunctional non-homologous end joining protein LigD